MAEDCAILSWHDAPPPAEGAVAVWAALSGAAGTLRLSRRRTDPVPATPPEALRHEILRPLAFSPL